MEKIHQFDPVHDAQRGYRKLLKALSNPGTEVDLKEELSKLCGEDRAFLVLALILLDNETTFCAFQNSTLRDAIIYLTLSYETDASRGDFLFVKDKKDLKKAVEHAKCGTPEDPQKAATVVVEIPEERDSCLKLSGPGIPGKRELCTAQIVFDALEERDALGCEYPEGLDFFFITSEGRFFAVPRLVKKEAI